jgi:AcrR family transcriptional regulator
MADRPLGRPRATGPSTSGLSTHDDILAAAGRLFCSVGFGGTSTYAIAREAGISQASMYHYFDGKHAILLELLMRTVHPSVEFATALLDHADEPAESRLWALCAYDVTLLVSGEENTGALYLLPELGDDRFASFHAERDRLQSVYRQLVGACDGVAPQDADLLTRLVFGLVESVILRRRSESENPEADAITGDISGAIADAALRIIGLPAEAITQARAAR